MKKYDPDNSFHFGLAITISFIVIMAIDALIIVFLSSVLKWEVDDKIIGLLSVLSAAAWFICILASNLRY